MERLTTDCPQSNLQVLMNYAYAKDRRVCLRYANGVDEKDLCEYIAEEVNESACDIRPVTPELVMEGCCSECDCNLAILNIVAMQAAELRGRLKDIEDILGDDYDLDMLRELVMRTQERSCTNET